MISPNCTHCGAVTNFEDLCPKCHALTQIPSVHGSIDLRDLLAAAIAIGIGASAWQSKLPYDDFADTAYSGAEAMLKRRVKAHQPTEEVSFDTKTLEQRIAEARAFLEENGWMTAPQREAPQQEWRKTIFDEIPSSRAALVTLLRDHYHSGEPLRLVTALKTAFGQVNLGRTFLITDGGPGSRFDVITKVTQATIGFSLDEVREAWDQFSTLKWKAAA